jgi:hypothetical protein
MGVCLTSKTMIENGLRGGTTMNAMDVIIEKTDRYAEELPSGGGMGSSGHSDTSFAPRTGGKVETASGDGENNGEREKQLEMWMDQVKLFIRNIDIDRL